MSDSTGSPNSMVLRLAAPLQSWGGHSEYNRRETAAQPTKSGVVGLLAAAAGYQRGADLRELVRLRLGVRVDEPGTLLRDFHTVSDYRGRPLPAAAVNAKGEQRNSTLSGRPKLIHVTKRFYLQDAIFVVAVSGDRVLLETLRNALRHPVFPLALGRRSCPPTLPLVLDPAEGTLWEGDPMTVLSAVPWQPRATRRWNADRLAPAYRVLSITVDDPVGADTRRDVPVSFAPRDRGFTMRPVTESWVRVPTLIDGAAPTPPPSWFTLLD
ncbi:type I-E CRISPR-associated protein Cas5/CasD [Nocardia colli]|uniref:Type I-E CRISPR-associated protein Cas5/CasD n=1 Tax=Nocardia colli TaxID=2545717 RepID=A0A5N0E2B2_9NOCA|nr:type I-E CRISPR-associated protein Cas5/CasD [Nocardia colli]KAA8881881.1 type I-E CRISPR-associated protein Cas5/CasD [Nocardia colli]